MMRKTLLIEDSQDNELLIIRSLKKAHVMNDVDVVRDGVEALEYLFGLGRYEGRAVAQPAITLLDLKLPKIGGLEVLKQIRDNPLTKHYPIVILTSSNEEKDIIKSYDLGANSYIQKPIDFTEFSAAVTEIGVYWLLLNKQPEETR